ncbi:hypothetical protein PCANB_000881 [Pneumocystis canis]|nr:hypothetical protein PCANB_000881 [Pneumocystis canis]
MPSLRGSLIKVFPQKKKTSFSHQLLIHKSLTLPTESRNGSTGRDRLYSVLKTCLPQETESLDQFPETQHCFMTTWIHMSGKNCKNKSYPIL